MKILNNTLLSFMLISTAAYANTKDDNHLPISHCYHWLQEDNKSYLSYKYEHAQSNEGELTFHTTGATSNGSIAGPGLYCAKSPSGSFSYGDRIIRLDFVEDIVMYDAKKGKKHCGLDGKYYKDQAVCDSKPWDIKFYEGGGKGNKAWYVISNPNAIKSWSSNSDVLKTDLFASITANNSQKFKFHINETIGLMTNEIEELGELVFINKNARISLANIIKDNPDKLAGMPALDNIKRGHKQNIERLLSRDTVDKFYRAQLLRVLLDSKLSSEDLKELSSIARKIDSILLDLLNEEIKKENTDLNYSIIKYFIVKRPKKVKLTQAYMDELLLNSIKASPHKAIEALEAYNSIGSWFISKSEKIFKIALEHVLPSSGEFLVNLTTRDLNKVMKLIGRKKFLMPEYDGFRDIIFDSKIESRDQTSNSAGQYFQVDGTKLYLGELDLNAANEDCQFLSLYSPKSKDFNLHVQGRVFSDSKENTNEKSVNSFCNRLVHKINTIKYTASCTIDDDPQYNAIEKVKRVSGVSIKETVLACTKQAKAKYGSKSSSAISNLDAKVTGYKRKYEAVCEIDDDRNFNSGIHIIGKLYGDDLRQMISDCEHIASAIYPRNHSSRLMRLKISKTKFAVVKAECHYDDDPNFDFNQGVLATIYGESYLDTQTKCNELVDKVINKSNYSSGIADVEFLIDLPVKGHCHIDNDPNFDEDQEVTYLETETKEELESICKQSQKKKYPMNGSYKVFYK